MKICIQKNQECYEKKIQELKAHFSGKRVVIFMNNGNCDWLFELAEDLDLMILKTILLGKKNEGNAGWNQRFSAEWSSYREMLRQEIEKSRPDLVLVNDPSALADIPEIMEIYTIARSFMCKTGNPTQWAGGYPKEELIRKDIASGDSYVAVENGRIEVVFFYRKGEDPTYKVIEDGAWLDDEPYAVLHRIASRGDVKDSGSACIQWCLAQWPNLRVDTHEDNHVMQHVLEKNGFVKCGRIYIEDGSSRIAYQQVRKEKK